MVYGFVEENGGRGPFINTIRTGNVLVIPQGLVHFTQNIDCKPARIITSFNSEDPGVITLSTTEFALPVQVLEATYNLSKEEILNIKAGLGGSLAKGNKECLKRCGIA